MDAFFIPIHWKLFIAGQINYGAHVFGLLSLFVAIFLTLIGTVILVRAPRNRLNILFFLYCLAAAYWAFAEAEYRHAGSYGGAYFWLKLSSFWALTPALALHFILVYTNQQRLLRLGLHYFTYALALIIEAADLAGLYVSGLPVERYWGWTYKPPDTLIGNLGTGITISMAIAVVGFSLRYCQKQTDPIMKKQALLVTFGLLVPLLAGIFDTGIQLAEIDIPELITIAFAIGSGVFIGYAIFRYQLFGITLQKAAGRIITRIGDGLLLLSPEGYVLTANPAALKLFGNKEGKIVGRPVRDFLDGGVQRIISRERDMPAGAPVPETGPAVLEMEAEVESADGRRHSLLLSLSPMRDNLGRLEGSILLARDISERKETENRIQRQSAELKERNTDLDVLYRISQTTRRTLDLKPLLSDSLEAITALDVFNVERKGAIFLIKGDHLELAAHQNMTTPFLESHHDVRVGECLCGLAAASGEVIVSPDAFADRNHTIRYPGMIPHGHAIVPIISVDRIIGILCLYLPPAMTLSEKHINLLMAIANQLAVMIDNSRHYEEVKSLSLHDPLTGLANRNLMRIELDRNLARARRSGRAFSLLMLDLDHFKKYNDEYGHLAGDRLLADIALILRRETREVDLAVRYGGEEFLVILADTEMERACEVAERIREQVGGTGFKYADDKPPAHITISAGVAPYAPGMPNWDILLTMADQALYDAKRKGRNRVGRWVATNSQQPDG